MSQDNTATAADTATDTATDTAADAATTPLDEQTTQTLPPQPPIPTSTPLPVTAEATKSRRMGGGAIAAIIAGGVVALALAFGGGGVVGWFAAQASVGPMSSQVGFPGGEAPDGTRMGPPGGGQGPQGDDFSAPDDSDQSDN